MKISNYLEKLRTKSKKRTRTKYLLLAILHIVTKFQGDRSINKKVFFWELIPLNLSLRNGIVPSTMISSEVVIISKKKKQEAKQMCFQQAVRAGAIRKQGRQVEPDNSPHISRHVDS